MCTHCKAKIWKTSLSETDLANDVTDCVVVETLMCKSSLIEDVVKAATVC